MRTSSQIHYPLPTPARYALEPLLMEYGVDLCVWAHEHSYERLWPMYNYTVLNGSAEHPYTNPRCVNEHSCVLRNKNSISAL